MSTLTTIRDTIGELYRGEIDSDTAEARIAELPSTDLAEFIVDAWNRDWISNFNLGLDEDGDPI